MTGFRTIEGIKDYLARIPPSQDDEAARLARAMPPALDGSEDGPRPGPRRPWAGLEVVDGRKRTPPR